MAHMIKPLAISFFFFQGTESVNFTEINEQVNPLKSDVWLGKSGMG